MRTFLVQLLVRLMKVKVLGVNLVSVVSNSNKSAKTETDLFVRFGFDFSFNGLFSAKRP